MLRRLSWTMPLIFLHLIMVLNLGSIIFPKSTTAKLPVLTSASSSRFVTRSEHSNLSFPSLQSNIAAISSLRGVNYYPSLNGWYYMWTNWNAVTVDSDFSKIATVLHANYVRIIIPADTNFGYPTPYPAKLDKLSQVIALANNHGLKVDLTLFDLFSNYTDVVDSKNWAGTVLRSYQNDPRIAFIDLQNELHNTNPVAVSWAKTMIPYVHSLAGNIPVTVSVSGGIPSLTLQVSNQVPVDFYEFHFYMNPAIAYLMFQEALHIIGTSRPFLIGEVGYSTLPSNTFLSGVSQTKTSQEAEQDQYIRTVEYAAQQLGLPFASPWNYSDFANNSNVLTGYLGTSQQYFGLYRSDGTLKPAGITLSRIFSGEPIDISFNNGFENCDTANLPTLWRVYQKASLGFMGTFSCDSSVSHTGLWSVRISHSVANNKGAPGFYLSPIQYLVPNQSYTATVWAKGVNVTGDPRISFSWFDINHTYLGKISSTNLPKGSTNWTRLSVTAVPPTNAASVEINVEVLGVNTGIAWFDDVNFGSNVLYIVPHSRYR